MLENPVSGSVAVAAKRNSLRLLHLTSLSTTDSVQKGYHGDPGDLIRAG